MKMMQEQLNIFQLNKAILLFIESSQHVKPITAMTFRGVMKDSENNKSTQFMFNTNMLFQTNMDKIITIILAF